MAAAHRNAREWMFTRLAKVHQAQERELLTAEGEELEDAIAIKTQVESLLQILPRLFDDKSEPTILTPFDLRTPNIMINESDEIAAVIDWELVSTEPLWSACKLPRVFDTCEDRHERPNVNDYIHEGTPQAEGTYEYNKYYDGVIQHYWEHLAEYEITVFLLPAFLEEMARLQPSWMKWYSLRDSRTEFADYVAESEWGSLLEDLDPWLEKQG